MKRNRIIASTALAFCLGAVAITPALATAPEPVPTAGLAEAQATADQLLRDAEAGLPAPAGPTSATLGGLVTAPGVVTPQGTVGGVRCDTQSVEDPHDSKGAGGAISKINIRCNGTGYTAVSLHVQGILQLAPSSGPTNPGGAYTTRASTDSWRTAVVNSGKDTTVYLPLTGSNGGVGQGWWKAYYTFYFTTTDGKLSDVANPNREIWKDIKRP